MKPKGLFPLILAVLFTLVSGVAFANHEFGPIIPQLPSTPTLSVPTVPENGDLNPYGVAFVPEGVPKSGKLEPGDILVSNFNDSNNTQGTGTTIVQISLDGTQSLFFQGNQGLGLTTALGVLKEGFVLVGNVPTVTTGSTAGTCTTGPNGEEEGVLQGSLLILDSNGNLIQTLTDSTFLDGPWDLTINDGRDFVQVFVSNVLSGTVTRLDLKFTGEHHGKQNPGVQVLKKTQIASGYTIRCDPAALVVGPTGLAYDQFRDILYVASTGDNQIFAIYNAGRTSKDNGTGKAVVNATDAATHLHGPLGLVLAPNGDLISSQGDAVNPDPNQQSEIVEFTPKGKFVAQFSIEPQQVGAAFGIALSTSKHSFIFAAVDDFLNRLLIYEVEK